MSEPTDQGFAVLRDAMVQEIAAHAMLAHDHTGREALDGTVMEVMSRVPRHEFVPLELRPYAYLNRPLPIGHGKTISQPFIVALMTDLLDVGAEDSVLEIGTGLGYQSAVLALLARRVYSVEIIDELAAEAKRRLGDLGYANVEVRVGDGSHGWPEHAPFDKIIVTAAPDLIPPMLLHQLKPGGRMVIPAGVEEAQQLLLVTKDTAGRIETTQLLPVRFSILETEAGTLQ